MVFVGCPREEERKEPKKKSAMAMGPERSRSLHNFSLPCLKWGSQRKLRCVKVDGNVGRGGGDHLRVLNRRSPTSSSKPHHLDFAGFSRKPLGPERKRRFFIDKENAKRSPSRIHPPAASEEIKRRSAVNSDEDDGIEAVRKKLMLDLLTEVDKMKFAVLSKGKEEVDPPPPPPPPLATTRTEAPTAETRPWNLRTRRAVCKEPNGNGGGGASTEGKPNFTPTMVALTYPARRSDGGAGSEYGEEKRPRAKFSVALSKQEVEEDFVAIMGTRPPRKPKKRSRCVQKQIDALFPGLFLSEITADLYKVNENPEGGKICFC